MRSKMFIMSYVRIITILGVILLAVGCHVQNQQPVVPKANQVAPVINTEQPKLLEQPPKLFSTNWQPIIAPFITKLLKQVTIDDNNQLLISGVKNNSNNFVSSIKINKIINNLLAKQTVFNIKDQLEVNQAKQFLGIPYDDGIIARTKIKTLARKIHADYILFTTIDQVPNATDNSASITMELLSVESDKLVWKSSSTSQ